jgi:hypothetical protein
MTRRLVFIRRLCALLALALLPLGARAFDLADLQTQLNATPVVRGHFVQQKFLRSPIAQDLRIDARGISRRDEAGKWQALPQHSGAGRENRLFLSVLAGDTAGLRENFDLALTGDADAWQLLLTPRSVLLRQIFDNIQINGGKLVDRIELRETQGDRSVLQMTDAQAAQALTAEEQRAFAD